MRRFFTVLVFLVGVAFICSAIYIVTNDSNDWTTAIVFGVIGSVILKIIDAGSGLKAWMDIFRGKEEERTDSIVKIIGDSSQVSLGENSRNINTGGGDYIEKLEITLSRQDVSLDIIENERELFTARTAVSTTPFLIGLVFDLSRYAFDSIYSFSDKDEDFFQRLVKAINRLVNKAISYSEHPHSKAILPKFSLFFYGFGFGSALSGLDSFARRLGLTPSISVQSDPIRDLLKIKADEDQLPLTPNASELSRYWKKYRSGILAQYFDMESKDASLIEALKVARKRFSVERSKNKYQPLLVIVTSGKYTDGNYAELLEVANAIKDDGVTLLIGYLGNRDILPPRCLIAQSLPDWDDEVNVLFQCSSLLDRNGKIGQAVSDMAIEKSWQLSKNAKLFLQVNHEEMLDELVDIVISPLRD